MSELKEEGFPREISALLDARPTLTGLELDRVASRVRGRVNRRPTNGWQRFIRTRAAVVAAIVGGGILSTGGTALGVSGLASSGSASITQYSGTQTPGNGSAVKPFSLTNRSPTTRQAVTSEEAAEQPAVTASGQLPFTGFLAGPMLLIGLALVVAGLVGRRAGRHARGA